MSGVNLHGNQPPPALPEIDIPGSPSRPPIEDRVDDLAHGVLEHSIGRLSELLNENIEDLTRRPLTFEDIMVFPPDIIRCLSGEQLIHIPDFIRENFPHLSEKIMSFRGEISRDIQLKWDAFGANPFIARQLGLPQMIRAISGDIDWHNINAMHERQDEALDRQDEGIAKLDEGIARLGDGIDKLRRGQAENAKALSRQDERLKALKDRLDNPLGHEDIEMPFEDPRPVIPPSNQKTYISIAVAIVCLAVAYRWFKNSNGKKT